MSSEKRIRRRVGLMLAPEKSLFSLLIQRYDRSPPEKSVFSLLRYDPMVGQSTVRNRRTIKVRARRATVHQSLKYRANTYTYGAFLFEPLGSCKNALFEYCRPYKNIEFSPKHYSNTSLTHNVKNSEALTTASL